MNHAHALQIARSIHGTGLSDDALTGVLWRVRYIFATSDDELRERLTVNKETYDRLAAHELHEAADSEPLFHVPTRDVEDGLAERVKALEAENAEFRNLLDEIKALAIKVHFSSNPMDYVAANATLMQVLGVYEPAKKEDTNG